MQVKKKVCVPFYRTQSPTRLAKWKSQSPGSHIWPEVCVQLETASLGELPTVEARHWFLLRDACKLMAPPLRVRVSTILQPLNSHER
jgi:hypothetical protein